MRGLTRIPILPKALDTFLVSEVWGSVKATLEEFPAHDLCGQLSEARNCGEGRNNFNKAVASSRIQQVSDLSKGYFFLFVDASLERVLVFNLS
jgi:hypothetical protein